MATVKLCFLVFIFFGILCLSLALSPKFVDQRINGEHVKQMSKDQFVESGNIRKRSVRSLVRNTRQTSDEACNSQESNFLQKLTDETVKAEFAHQYAFPNESKYSIALVWVGFNTQKILATVTEENAGSMFPFGGSSFAEAATVYLSRDEGKSFTNITQLFDAGKQIYIKRSNGLQKNPTSPDQIYIVAHGENIDETDLYISKDSAETFTKAKMPFVFNKNFVFHPTDQSYVLALDSETLDLYISKNFGNSWNLIRDKVISYRWSNDGSIYVDTDANVLVILGMIYPSGQSQLEKSTDGGSNWETIHENIKTFGNQGNFLYASIQSKQNDEERYMEVSTDGGETWNEVQLPSITDDRFYSILDMSEGQIFMHVDDPGDTGVGILYSSDAQGIIFSESLDRHLYPNYEDLTDFYKVESMRGVYICSQLQRDLSIRTMISRDRGGEWFPIQRPAGVPCKDEAKECYLQIHNQYSANRGVKASPPKSSKSAIGIILVHGHVASSLQTTDPDVFITSDGGYTWRLALEGPHHYEIADQGGLIVAIPSETSNPDTIRFSTDEGRCWHSYKFTDEKVVFTGLLTEPGGTSMSVAIWGYGQTDKNWRVHTVDFEKIIPNKCTDQDYDTWVSHWDNDNKGCLLGKTEEFQRLKPDSWCLNGHTREITKNKKVTTCECTMADYDCDYGFIRDESDQCNRDEQIKASTMDICKRGHLEELVYFGYHKIPGDACVNGITPKSDTVIELKKHCVEGDKSIIMQEEGISVPVQSKHRMTMAILITVALLAFLMVTILVMYIVKKYRDLKQSKLVYRYSTVRTEENEQDDLERALAAHTSLYEDSSDDEPSSTTVHMRQANGNVHRSSVEPITNNMYTPPPPPSNVPNMANGSVLKPAPNQSLPPVSSYHDDSDEDMLE